MRPKTPRSSTAPRRSAGRGFTLLELIIVIAMVGILAAVAIPNLIQAPTRAKEAVLKTNLRTLREVIDQHYGDQGFYPPALETLVDEGYLRNVPMDPMTGEAEWALVYDSDSYDDTGLSDPYGYGYDDGAGVGGPGIIDVHSLSDRVSIDGTPYSEW
ncbi:MAG: type II secretion system protein [Acidobacteriota bacterium]